jgi:salicylate hydroxylase
VDVEEHLHRTARFHRGHLHGALLRHVPREIIHLDKKLVSAEPNSEEGVTMTFRDGTVVTADLLVGADGIRSVRCQYIVINSVKRNKAYGIRE